MGSKVIEPAPWFTGTRVIWMLAGLAGFGTMPLVLGDLNTAATDRAKDLGVINIASAAPQVLGPAIAAPILPARLRLAAALTTS